MYMRRPTQDEFCFDEEEWSSTDFSLGRKRGSSDFSDIMVLRRTSGSPVPAWCTKLNGVEEEPPVPKRSRSAPPGATPVAEASEESAATARPRRSLPAPRPRVSIGYKNTFLNLYEDDVACALSQRKRASSDVTDCQSIARSSLTSSVLDLSDLLVGQQDLLKQWEGRQQAAPADHPQAPAEADQSGRPEPEAHQSAPSADVDIPSVILDTVRNDGSEFPPDYADPEVAVGPEPVRQMQGTWYDVSDPKCHYVVNGWRCTRFSRGNAGTKESVFIFGWSAEKKAVLRGKVAPFFSGLGEDGGVLPRRRTAHGLDPFARRLRESPCSSTRKAEEYPLCLRMEPDASSAAPVPA
mmetsp:Transcript_24665/g.62940  ORF Transcript_24665/g.62940 Transcript_24665/m.62940 type:complete len:352 (-) Transcript_24665:912-1967(-)